MFQDPFSFDGRIRRKEYVITHITLYIISLILVSTISEGEEGIFLVIYFVIVVAIVWIQLAQTAKRCHDVNKSGWYQLIPCYTIYLLFADGDRRKNLYGPDPKYKEDDNDQAGN